MHFSNWLLFCGVTLLVTFSPGPAVLPAISNSVPVGARRAVMGSLGNATGMFMISAAANAWLGVVLAKSAAAFTALTIAGAAYLVYPGVKQWRSKGRASVRTDTPAVSTTPNATRRLFGQVVTVALANPKSILLFSALFPQFVTHDAPIPEQFVMLTSSFAAC